MLKMELKGRRGAKNKFLTPYFWPFTLIREDAPAHDAVWSKGNLERSLSLENNVTTYGRISHLVGELLSARKVAFLFFRKRS